MAKKLISGLEASDMNIVQGYPAHKKTPYPMTLHKAFAYRPLTVLAGGAFSCKCPCRTLSYDIPRDVLHTVGCRGTSLIGIRLPLRPYSRTIPRVIWWF